MLELKMELIFCSADFLVQGQIRVLISHSSTQPKTSILVSKIRFWGGEQFYGGLTQKFHFYEKPLFSAVVTGQKLKMTRIRFCFDRKMRPSKES